MKDKLVDKTPKSKEPAWTKKDFKAVLMNFMFKHCPQVGGELMVGRLVEDLIKTIETYFPAVERMKMGQVLWYAVAVDETAGYGKSLERCELVPVSLDLIHQEDIDAYIAKEKKRKRNIRKTVRLFKQAYDQGGVLTNADVGGMIGVSASTISSYVREHEKEHKVSIPRRGNIHDLGPTLTHKRIICVKHYQEGKSIEQTARETNHSVRAVTRYTNDFKRVMTCLKEGWDFMKVSSATGLSHSLVKEYINLIQNNGEAQAES